MYIYTAAIKVFIVFVASFYEIRISWGILYNTRVVIHIALGTHIIKNVFNAIRHTYTFF